MTPDLRTEYLGLKLPNPLVVAANPMVERLDMLVQFEQAGAAAAVMPSLFEEQIRHEEDQISRLEHFGAESFAEALDYFPDLSGYNSGPDRYLKTLEAAKKSVSIPIIGSLNGATPGGWVRYARRIADAGADALELNLYAVHSDLERTSFQIEEEYLELVAAVRSAVAIPMAVKLAPLFTAPANFGQRLAQAGVNGLVLFNRLVHPDIDLETLEMRPNLVLSEPYEARLALTWIGILFGRVPVSLAATGGVHSAAEVIKLLLAGADVTMMAAALFRHGPGHLTAVLDRLTDWLRDNEYESVTQLKGSLSQIHCPDPNSYERLNYMRSLVAFAGPGI